MKCSELNLRTVSFKLFCVFPLQLDVAWIVEKVEIPSDIVGLVIGRKGANIKQIEAKTGTAINFVDDGEFCLQFPISYKSCDKEPKQKHRYHS